MKHKIHFMKWFVWGCAAVFYLYEYFLRVAPSVMVDDLMKSFGVNAAAIGVLSAFYFYAYSPMQIPVGMLMDRYGARRLLTFSTFICGVGSLFFCFAPMILVADFGRLLIGMGSAFAFVGIVYVSSTWFPPSQLALLVGLGNSFGMIGAIGGQDLLSFLVDSIGWRLSMFILGGFGFILALIIYIGMKREPKGKKKKLPEAKNFKEVLTNLKFIAANRNSWINGILSLMFYATMSAFAGLWAVPFITKTYAVSKELAALAVSMNFFGWLLGGPLIGFYSDKIHSRRTFLFGAALLSLIALSLIIYMPPMPMALLFILFFLIGIFSSAQLLTFSISIEINPDNARGSAAAFTNFLVSAGGIFMAPLIGYLIDALSSGEMVDGVPVYTTTDFRYGLIVLPISLIITMILCFFLNETPYAKQPQVKAK